MFFDYYNHEHRHGALGLHTPASVHLGTVPRSAPRAVVLDAAYASHPQIRSAAHSTAASAQHGSTNRLRRR